MKSEAFVPGCPVCGFTSIYTDGTAPCSVRCALELAQVQHTEHRVPLSRARLVAKEEAEARGLPKQPLLRDIREPVYRYVVVRTHLAKTFWSVDRDLLDSRLNVEYMWVLSKGRDKCRIYRFAPSLMPKLPASLDDFKLRNLTDRDIRNLCSEGSQPYWHFLRAP